MFTRGWKDVLRPIRDGLRDLFPSPDRGPTPEERRRQRRLDALDGFAYFDDFDQLSAWKPQDADAVQKANTPLLPRIVDPCESRSKVLLCHDMSGNYHRYESCQSTGVEQQDYHCEYLQFVDCFVYFSHKLVCLPPPTWTNSLHRNGVKVLGTLLVERQTAGLDRLLDKSQIEGEEQYAFASQLARVANVYGFDGWLVNIEKNFPSDAWELSSLLSFLRQLKQRMGDAKQLLWYDALTLNNRVEYQNGLTEENVQFAQACGSLLTNYSWTFEGASLSKDVASSHQIDASHIYFGIDTWAQNATHGLSKRMTYPENGGGGTNTGIAVQALQRLGFSAGIFAPAWTFEHFPRHGAVMERCMWEGDDVSQDITCSCRSASQHPTNKHNPITLSARPYPSGSPSFFYTNFSRAFASHDPTLDEIYGGKRLHAQLGSQSVLPLPSSQENMRDCHGPDILFCEIKDNPSCCVAFAIRLSLSPHNLSKNLTAHPDATGFQARLPLFSCLPDGVSRTGNGKFRLRMKYRLLTRRHPTLEAYILLHGNSSLKYRLGDALDKGIEVFDIVFETSPTSCANTLALQVRDDKAYDFPSGTAIPVIEIHEISITKTECWSLSCTIGSLGCESRGEGETRHWRLLWAFEEHGAPGKARQMAEAAGRPYSDSTGPFSHFLIFFDGLCVGCAHATEFILNGVLSMRMRRSEGVKVKIVGVSFDGEICESDEVVLMHQDPAADKEWCVVQGPLLEALSGDGIMLRQKTECL